MNKSNDLITFTHQINLSFGDLFQHMSSFQKAFFNQVRNQTEALFDDWEGCDGSTTSGKVTYHDVIFRKKHYDYVIVDYYYGKLYIGDDIIDLNIEVSYSKK